MIQRATTDTGAAARERNTCQSLALTATLCEPIDTYVRELIQSRPGGGSIELVASTSQPSKTVVSIDGLYSFIIFNMSVPKRVVSEPEPFLEATSSKRVGN